MGWGRRWVRVTVSSVKEDSSDWTGWETSNFR